MRVMPPNLVLVIDAGSSSIRCHLVDPAGKVTRSVSRPWAYQDEPDAGTFERSFDLEACWKLLCSAISECTSDGEHRPHSVSITSQRQSLVFVDSQGRPIHAGPNTDTRAVFQGSALDAQHGALLYQTTGHRPTFMMAAGKLAWLRDTRPAECEELAHVFTLADWIAYRLTGNLGCEPTLAAASGLLDIRTRTWASDMFEELSLRCPKSSLHEATEIRGTVNAREIASISGTPVVVAGADTQCGMLGAGVVETGQVGIIAGWSAPVQMLVPEPVQSSEMKTWTGLFQIPELWALESSAGDIGNVWHWIVETLSGSGLDYEKLDSLAGTAPLGSFGVTGHFGPQAMDMSVVGMRLGGILFPTPITFGGPTPGQIGRAALESFSYAIRANLEQLESESGITADSIALGGGLSRSTTFRRILPDVLGRPISTYNQSDVTALGCAAIAMTAMGEYSSLAETAAAASQEARTSAPGPAAAAEYQDHYERWLEVHESIGPLLA
ncbi:MAG: FGGY-family carbohydrate kinase [Dehalococcoidia bacterium]|nr:FGGY-family carbohydrate kinase [Dehalococcoidia bacterium]